MKYLALLRGVNVGGNSIIKMSDLKEAVEKRGFASVKTFINSGNVIFESNEVDSAKIIAILEETLKRRFNLESRVFLLNHKQFQDVVDGVPEDWKKSKDIRCYIAFVREPAVVKEVMKEIKPKQGVDFLQAGRGAVYLTTLTSGLTKSGFTKLISSPVYKDITLRNYNTALKLLNLMK
jgi:uncharacterized protein (DUF1697 family)